MLRCGTKDGAETLGCSHRGGVSLLFVLVVQCSVL